MQERIVTTDQLAEIRAKLESLMCNYLTDGSFDLQPLQDAIALLENIEKGGATVVRGFSVLEGDR